MLFHFITHVIVNSEAISCEGTVAFATAQISQHICRATGSACRGDRENAAVYSKEKFYQLIKSTGTECSVTRHITPHLDEVVSHGEAANC